jgi:glycine betaine/proline transport system substrate-binding protein
LAWLRANPVAANPWLEGVKTFDGKDGLAAVQAALQ